MSDLGCYDCGMPYGEWPDYAIDNHLWEKLSPTNDEGGLLCLNCCARRYQNLYGVFGAEGPPALLIVHVAGVTLGSDQ